MPLKEKELRKLKSFLDQKVDYYNQPSFIPDDPISIPHRYSKKQDIEIAGFWTAMLSWGQRKTILNKSAELMELMDDAPHDFIINHEESDRKRFLTFKHRTFQADDTLYFLSFFQDYYRNHSSLESAFIPNIKNPSTAERLSHFHHTFFSLPDLLQRTRKHVSTPDRKSSCKRLNMFLRWMVREDQCGVDFGIWKNINPAELMIPLDVHVYRVAHHLQLLSREKTDWQAVEELTSNLKLLDPQDPVKYDFALFSIGVIEK